MLMRSAFPLMLLIVTLASNVAGVTRAKFDSTINCIQSEHYDSAWMLISQLELEEPVDPEYYVLAINYYYLKSVNEIVRVEQSPPQDGQRFMVATDSVNQSDAYMYSDIQIDFDTLRMGTAIMKRGLSVFPDRLDMHFGLVHTFQAAELYAEMTSALIQVLARARENHHHWQWSFSEPLEDNPVEFVLENVQSRIMLLAGVDIEVADSLILDISEQMILTFPKSTYGYSNLGYVRRGMGDRDAAMKHFVQAHEIDSTDAIVLVNLGQLCEDAGRSQDAIHYYEQLMHWGDSNLQALAKARLVALGRNK